MNDRMEINGSDRVLILLPHPDDETLATGGLIQQVLATGASLRVLIATDGDNNPWPQRWMEKRWHIDARARARWGARRREEAQLALSILGADSAAVHQLGWPDQGLTDALMRDGQAEDEIANTLEDFKPTVLVAPALHDRHPDHNALGMMLELTLLGQPRSDCRRYNYVVHGELGSDDSLSARYAAPELAIKQRALLAHATQLSLSRRRLFRLARRTEQFAAVESGKFSAASARHTWVLPQTILPGRLRLLELLLLVTACGRVIRARLPIGNGDGRSQHLIGQESGATLTLDVSRAGRQLQLDIPDVADIDSCFAKLERTGRRLVIYDRQGWVRLGHTRKPF